MAKKEIILVQEPEGIPWALYAVYTPNPWKKGLDLSNVEEKSNFNNQSKLQKLIVFSPSVWKISTYVWPRYCDFSALKC